ncbi:plasmid mobilization protein [Haloarcula sp. JP-L23]|uniref:plasmid mobilization protein n=1 Tax=Haloarcula sp. JP-L23 TaxID=2716717 RepID=UPI00140F4498|nr:hypothetical protein G9465_23550 [Haloarcula sp. JP-L23]
MSERVAFYPSADQKQIIEQMADRHGMSVSEYCILALDRQIASELRSERVAETDLEQKLDGVEDTVVDEIESAFAPSTDEERLYGVALWNLLGTEHSSEARADAMSTASERLDSGLEKLREKAEEKPEETQ